jgi:RHH-type transcriptional regulator, proline utilization regulon repressor / proline dehydrogenase / delta 1-pyrroline-5-carboxylate dehydrogenase
VAASQRAALIQIGAILATGNDAIVSPGEELALKGLPAELTHRVKMALFPIEAPALAGVLFEGKADDLADAMRRLAARPGPIVRLQALTPARLAAGEDYNLADLVEECAIATNTAAAGGNASLMAIG